MNFGAKLYNISDITKLLSKRFIIMEEKIIQARLKAVCEALGISMRQFSLSIGRSAGFINSLRKTKGDGITSDLLSKISEVYPMVNRDYILEGNGEPLLDETDTLSVFPHTFQPQADNYKELCMAYRQDLADAREEIKRLRDAYYKLMEANNKLLADYASLSAFLLTSQKPVSIQAASQSVCRDNIETKKA